MRRTRGACVNETGDKPVNFGYLAVIYLFIAVTGCSSIPHAQPYNGIFYAQHYFVDARALYDEQLTPKSIYKNENIQLVDFEFTDKIKLEFDRSRFVANTTGQLPEHKMLYYARGSLAHRVTIHLDLEKVEVVELLDLQARNGCLDYTPRPTNIAVARPDPTINMKTITFSIKMPCRRYYTIPDNPLESLLMVKVKTTDKYYYTIHKLYSVADECIRLWCPEGYEDPAYGG